jgi:hypothetical protein
VDRLVGLFPEAKASIGRAADHFVASHRQRQRVLGLVGGVVHVHPRLVAREEANEHHPAARALRDALGVVRVLYAMTRDGARRRALEGAGKHLGNAVDMTKKHPGSLGYQTVPIEAAWAFEALLKVTWSPEIMQLIEAARDCVEGKQRRAHEVEAGEARKQKH